MRWIGHVAHMGVTTNSYILIAQNILVGKSEGERPLGRPRRRWDDIIRLDLREIGWEGINWIHLPPDRYEWRAFVNTVMNLRVT
jgi:hypothetical protein